MQKPTINRSVHYQAYGTPNGEHPSVPRAAIITEVTDETKGIVSLAVFNPTGLFFNCNVEYSETPKPGCWNWPPR